jgi:hypothetical protein
MKLKVTLTIERQIEVPLDACHDGAKLIQAVELSALEDPRDFINDRGAKISVEAIQVL